MNGHNDLKYYVISDITQKYVDINQKILNFTKLYFYTMKNHSYQITQIENKLNEYNIKGEVKIKQLLEKQQNIIKELIKIINNLLFENRNNQISKKLEEQIKMDSCQLKTRNLIANNSNHIFSKPYYNNIKNNFKDKRLNSNENIKNVSTNETLRSNLTKSVDDKNTKKILNQKKVVALNIIAPKNGNEFNGALSFLNIKSSNPNNKKKIFGKFLNKEKIKKNPKPLKKKFFKSMSTSEISFKPKINNKNNIYLKTTNISNNNPYYINNNYTIDEDKNDNIEFISFINERQNSIGSSNINENYGNLPSILTKRKKRIKYRDRKILLTEKDNNKNMVRVKSAKEIPIKTEFYINTNSSIHNFNINNISFEKNGNFSFNKRSNSSLCFFNANSNELKENYKSIKKVENEVYSMPYINNGKIIIPTRFTKEVLNSSYKILSKYEQKRFKNY